MLGLSCCTGLPPPPRPRPAAYVICGCSCMAPTLQYSPSAQPDVLLYFHLFRSVGPRGGANLLAPRLLQGAGRLRTLPVAGQRRRFGSTGLFWAKASSPSWSSFRALASASTLPRTCHPPVPTTAAASYRFHCLPSTARPPPRPWKTPALRSRVGNFAEGCASLYVSRSRAAVGRGRWSRCAGTCSGLLTAHKRDERIFLDMTGDVCLTGNAAPG